jgi:CubicO group peptidase (beta-lactamase class C family)
MAPWGGSVASGFEPVLREFVAGLGDLGTGGGAFAAFHQGRPVVDLWGGWARPAEPWTRDTLAVLFSSTKGLTTLCLQLLHDRGALDLDGRVSDIWPEFAAADKGRIRVRHVLAHTAGVLAPVDPASIFTWQGAGWSDVAAIETALASAPSVVPIGSTFAYHALTFGWLADAIVRRLAGRSVGRFLAEEVAGPLGLDLHIGTRADDLGRVATVLPVPAVELPPEAAAVVARARGFARDPDTLIGRAFLALPDGDLLDHVEDFNLPALLEAEIPAVNGTGTASSLARLYSVLAGGGEADGVRLVSQAAIDRFRSIEILGPNAIELEYDPPTQEVELHHRMLGYHGSSRPFGLPGRLGPSQTAFGHDGLGGQIAFADPESSLAMAFVRSQPTGEPLFSARLIEMVYELARAT